MDDRISTFPDEILCHILSFLPTEEAVATSALSKRWKPLWLSLPNLHLDYESYLERFKSFSHFKKMLNQTFYERSVHLPPIERLSLKSVSYAQLKAIVQDEVDCLATIMRLPFAVAPVYNFRFRRLVSLKLKVISVVGGRFTRPVLFPSLKTLHLNNVTFDEDLHFVMIVNGCPILEDLEAHECAVVLVHVVLWGGYDAYEIEQPLAGYERVAQNEDDSAAEVPIFSNLTNGELDVPMFSNLTHLEAILIKYYFPSLVNLFKNFTKLQSIVLDNPGSDKEVLHSRYIRSVFEYDMFCPCSASADDEAMIYPVYVADCLSSQFRKCTLRDYRGEKHESRFVEYIMQNSTSLRSMTIHCLPSLNSQEKLEILKELSLCPKSSPTLWFHMNEN